MVLYSTIVLESFYCLGNASRHNFDNRFWVLFLDPWQSHAFAGSRSQSQTIAGLRRQSSLGCSEVVLGSFWGCPEIVLESL